jgi:hypothetical protein
MATCLGTTWYDQGCINMLQQHWEEFETFWLSINHCHCLQHPIVILGMLWLSSFVVLSSSFLVLHYLSLSLASSHCHPMSTNISSLCLIIFWTKTWCLSNQNFATLKLKITRMFFWDVPKEKKDTISPSSYACLHIFLNRVKDIIE